MGASLAHLTTAHINVTRRKAFAMDSPIDVGTCNPNHALYFRYHLNNVLKLSGYLSTPWTESDLIVQIAWIPRLHFPVGYVIAPASELSSRVSIKCDQCDLEKCNITGFTITSPDGKAITHTFRDFFDEDDDLEEETLVDKDEISQITRMPAIEPGFDFSIIPARFSMREINHRYGEMFR